jgi:hypothetical protein
MHFKFTFFILLYSLIFGIFYYSEAQQLYTAEGYWIEFQKDLYQQILQKQTVGDAITVEENNFLQDYGAYLQQYYSRLTETEKLKVDQMMEDWEFEGRSPVREGYTEDFDLRTRDKLINGVYGAIYGGSLVAIAEIEGGLAVGIPLIMAGAWQLGPVINKRKYENISLATIRAGNTGKILGLGYGAAMGLAISGNSDDSYKWVLGLATIGSITLGELAFQNQKQKNHSLGYVEMVRLYGFLGPITTGLTSLAIDVNNSQLLGAALVAGGIGGLLIGRSVAKKYDYTQGDVDVVNSLMLISGGLGATVAVGSIDSESNTGLLLIPAATAVAGTLFGQKAVRGIQFTKKQGSTVKLASGGAALIGLGAVALTESDEPAWYVGAASVCSLVIHQILFSSYKKKNMESNFKIGHYQQNPIQLSMHVNPENYIIHKNYSREILHKNPNLSFPIVSFTLEF